jgi:hypothetical protein
MPRKTGGSMITHKSIIALMEGQIFLTAEESNNEVMIFQFIP